MSLYSFFANGALFGPSVYVNYTAAIFETTPNVTSRLVTYPNLAFGYGAFLSILLLMKSTVTESGYLGSLVFVPLYHRYGRRPVMILSVIIVSHSHSILTDYSFQHVYNSSWLASLAVPSPIRTTPSWRSASYMHSALPSARLFPHKLSAMSSFSTSAEML